MKRRCAVGYEEGMANTKKLGKPFFELPSNIADRNPLRAEDLGNPIDFFLIVVDIGQANSPRHGVRPHI